jgi:1,4-alpha-glucan branching enzyme
MVEVAGQDGTMSADSKPAATDRQSPAIDVNGMIRIDPWLGPYADRLRHRGERYLDTRRRVVERSGSLKDFAGGHHYFGFTRGEHGGRPGVWYREWAPKAIAMSLIGDFNNWDRMAHPLHPVKERPGVWARFLLDSDGPGQLEHGGRVKVHVHSVMGQHDRIPAYIRRVEYEPRSNHFVAQYWNPPQPYEWKHACFPLRGNLRVYEAHVGMATEEERIGTYDEFTEQVLPRIVKAGYNAVQLMAIQEHPYYGSFGYQVSSFFAPSSRFGTPEQLKALIDTAHGSGLLVLLDLVHSHAVKNIYEGLNHFDGTEYQYFHAGGRGQHPAWDSLCFDYGKLEVLEFLLSNVRYWLEEYRFDGFRFDGVTSMMYLDHGLGRDFRSYDDYFPPHVDEEAIVYLQLANELIDEVSPHAIRVAEDMSGMVGLARPIEEGGLGFDYRLAMGIPDYWIKVLKERKDEDWQMLEMYQVLVNRRQGEKHIAYAESHDQALVGDKTIAMWLMDADIYYHMTKQSRNIVVERGMALHKMIRLVTFALGGEGYLNFMGNEFGHPEWIDFPREGNGYSFKYARRQWKLVDDERLRYHDLASFDRAMQELDIRYNLLGDPFRQCLHVHEDQKLLVFRRGPLVFAFNFHPHNSYADYRIGVPDPSDYQLVLCTDEVSFGGYGQVVSDQVYPHVRERWHEQPQWVQLYLPSRTALVLLPVERVRPQGRE